MTDAAKVPPQPGSMIPPDDPQRKIGVANPDGPNMQIVVRAYVP
jgi:hypothetical protein